MEWATIHYRDFYDLPRIFVTSYQEQLYLFDCPFDDELDDYPNSYRVYQLPALTESELEGSWEQLPARATGFLGAISLTEDQFDPTRRERINTEILKKLLARQASPTALAA